LPQIPLLEVSQIPIVSNSVYQAAFNWLRPERPSPERPSLERLSPEWHLSECDHAKNDQARNASGICAQNFADFALVFSYIFYTYFTVI
jgi:hypothetical protein